MNTITPNRELKPTTQHRFVVSRHPHEPQRATTMKFRWLLTVLAGWFVVVPASAGEPSKDTTAAVLASE